MKFIPVRCDLHGWLLLNREFVEPQEKHVIECEGHMITRDTRNVPLFETAEQPLKTRRLTDAEHAALFPDGFTFFAYCQECQEKRSVCCSRTEARKGKPIKVYAITCDHTWTLSAADAQKVREQIDAAA